MHSGRSNGDADCLAQKFGWSGGDVTGVSLMDIESIQLVHASTVNNEGHTLIGVYFKAQVRAFVVNFNEGLLVFFC